MLGLVDFNIHDRKERQLLNVATEIANRIKALLDKPYLLLTTDCDLALFMIIIIFIVIKNPHHDTLGKPIAVTRSPSPHPANVTRCRL